MAPNGVTFTEEHARPFDEMCLPVHKAESIPKLLVEGMSIRSIERVTRFRDTILRLLVLADERCTIATNAVLVSDHIHGPSENCQMQCKISVIPGFELAGWLPPALASRISRKSDYFPPYGTLNAGRKVTEVCRP